MTKDEPTKEGLGQNGEQESELREIVLRQERTIESLRLQLAAAEDKINRITGSLGWKLLNLYGPIKYRYLLPIYRMLGLPPYDRREPRLKERVPAIGKANSWEARVQTTSDQLEKVHLSGPAGEVARRFSRFRNRGNRLFFNALSKHLSPILEDPCLSMYFEFAISTNERGDYVAKLLEEHVPLKGKNYLDIGCAYGGFPVAFAKLGARVTGIDVDEQLLALARCNLEDHGIEARLLRRNATRSEEMSEFRESFDVITCNDVIEHVVDPLALLENVAGLLRVGGVAYFEIPNGKYPRFVLSDGHFQIFGITLLDHPEAQRYYKHARNGQLYEVYTYADLDGYRRMFEKAGLELTLLDESVRVAGLSTTLDDVQELRTSLKGELAKVPEELRELVAVKSARYLDEVESAPRDSDAEKREFLIRYGVDFWRVLARKKNL
jgi:2-polyprenyl-3-methyl-5-hydroxy-6-metoxy-1,4-benzoquinol methylase